MKINCIHFYHWFKWYIGVSVFSLISAKIFWDLYFGKNGGQVSARYSHPIKFASVVLYLYEKYIESTKNFMLIQPSLLFQYQFWSLRLSILFATYINQSGHRIYWSTDLNNGSRPLYCNGRFFLWFFSWNYEFFFHRCRIFTPKMLLKKTQLFLKFVTLQYEFFFLLFNLIRNINVY